METKRACLFAFDDAYGVADKYVFYNLEELRTVCDYIIVVVNGKICPKYRDKLSDVCDEMFVRENVGFNLWAYKDALAYIGWNELRKNYDELILCSSDVFGPIKPLQEIFRSTDDVECDFWGSTLSYEDKSTKSIYGVQLKGGYKCDALDSGFVVFRKRILNSIEFKRFWDTLPTISSRSQAEVVMEQDFSYAMTESGFRLYSCDNAGFRNASPNPSVQSVCSLVSAGVPYIKRKAFFSALEEYTRLQRTSVITEAMDYIDNHTDYDADMIMENIIRTSNQYDFHKTCTQTKVLPTEFSNYSGSRKIAVIFHAFDINSINEYVSCLNSFPRGTDMYIVADAEKWNDGLTAGLKEGNSVKIIDSNRFGKSVTHEMVIALCSRYIPVDAYDYVCFMHNEQCNSLKWDCEKEAYRMSLCGNVAFSTEYILNILELFERNPRMGLAVPPPPTHGLYYRFTDGDWDGHYNTVFDILKKYGVSVLTENDKPPIAPYGTIFWFRSKALEYLFEINWDETDFNCGNSRTTNNARPLFCTFDYVIPYFCQYSGYYPMRVMTNNYAQEEIVYASSCLKKLYDISNNSSGHQAPNSSICIRSIKEFVSKYVSGNAEKNGGEAAADKAENKRTLYEKLSGLRLKKIIKAVVPHSIYEKMRKKKCEATGEVYIKI